MKKNKKPMYAIVALLLLTVVGLTIAYFSSTGSITNLFTAGTYRVVSTEVFESPDNWKPNEEIPKTITTKNEGNIDAAVRIRYKETWLDENGINVTSQVPEGTAIINFDNEDDWTKDGDYYYYNYRLRPNEETSSFIKSVTLNPELNGVTCIKSQDGSSDRCESTVSVVGGKYILKIIKETVQYDKYQEVWTSNVEIEENTTAIQMIMNKAISAPDGKDPVAINLSATDQVPATTTYRYMGIDPDNYILFNCSTAVPEQQNANTCEVWRIIGIVDGKVKIIRDSSIGKKKWEPVTKYIPLEGDDTTSYEWEESGLYSYLNGSYYNSLNTSAKTAIDNSTWYLGYWTGLSELYDNLEPPYNNYEGTHEGAFTGTAYYGERSRNPNALYNYLNYSSTGNVGLMYPSDYGFASSACYSTCIASNSSCGSLVGTYHLTTSRLRVDYPELILEKDYSASECKNSNWLYKNMEELTLTSSGGGSVMTITPGGALGTVDANTPHYIYDSNEETTIDVRPTVYLKNIVIITGSGSRNDPYKIVG